MLKVFLKRGISMSFCFANVLKVSCCFVFILHPVHSSHTAVSSGHPSLVWAYYGGFKQPRGVNVSGVLLSLLYFMSLEIASSSPGCPETGCVVEGGIELFKITFKSSIYEAGA